MNELTPNTESYLYLHPSENSAVALVSPALDSSNYHSWSRTYGAWSHCNNMVVSWIVHSVSVAIRQSILWMNKAEEIWNDLKSRYAQGDLLRISDLQQEASSIKQEYFTKLHIIGDEIENFRPDPTCSCTIKCTCSVLIIIA
uniref:Retrotransposon Copia-like N-terminal domain-containing protein n=1 Tax=Glycine max TaxID=3847 RepID=A0A0R0G3J2_SOYBN